MWPNVWPRDKGKKWDNITEDSKDLESFPRSILYYLQVKYDFKCEREKKQINFHHHYYYTPFLQLNSMAIPGFFKKFHE